MCKGTSVTLPPPPSPRCFNNHKTFALYSNEYDLSRNAYDCDGIKNGRESFVLVFHRLEWRFHTLRYTSVDGNKQQQQRQELQRKIAKIYERNINKTEQNKAWQKHINNRIYAVWHSVCSLLMCTFV